MDDAKRFHAMDPHLTDSNDPDTGDLSNHQLQTTREALSEHLHSAVHHLVPNLADKVTGMLVECPTAMMTAMLSDRRLLSQRVKEAVDALKQTGEHIPTSLSEEKQKLGDELFEKVAEMECELCAQITGMLLEMDEASIQRLLDDVVYLESAVTMARTEYLREHHPGLLPTREEFGDEIFECASASHPEQAGKITGMLLELQLTELQRLVDQPELMKAKIDQAARVIKAAADS